MILLYLGSHYQAKLKKKTPIVSFKLNEADRSLEKQVILFDINKQYVQPDSQRHREVHLDNCHEL